MSFNQQEINANHQNFLNQLDNLASQAASAQTQIASEAAQHEFRVRFNHYLQKKMAIAAAETYSEVLQEVQDFINQFAQQAANRALDVERSTAQQIEGFKPDTPQFASFSETLSQQRNQQSNLLRLNDVQLNSDADIQALQSLGITSDSNPNQVEIHENTSNLDAKQIEANLIAQNNNNVHNGNGRTSA